VCADTWSWQSMSTATEPHTDDVPALDNAPASGRDRARDLGSRAFAHAHLVLPGALTAFLCFRAGGFFPAIAGTAAVVVAGLLLLRVTLASAPFAGWARG